MGADAFTAWYGLRIEISVEGGVADAVMAPFEDESDTRMRAAKSAGLEAWVDRDTNGGTYFLAIGKRLGDLGLEHGIYVPVSDTAFLEAQLRTRAQLISAGINGEPALHLQLISDY